MTREEATQELAEWRKQMKDHGVPPYSTKYKALGMAIEALKAESVVSCKECKHNEGGTCGYSEFNIEVDDYCSFGERRTR